MAQQSDQVANDSHPIALSAWLHKHIQGGALTCEPFSLDVPLLLYTPRWNHIDGNELSRVIGVMGRTGNN